MSDNSTLSSTAVPCLPRGVRIRYDETREQWTLLGPERVLKLDAIALEILKRCDGAANIEEIVEDLAKSFEADPSMVEKDVAAFLLDLQSRRMLEVK